MDELIFLLNSYERYKERKYHHRNYIWKYDKQWGISAHRIAIQEEYLGDDESRAIIISKGYNFIKWLVDNDKIDFTKLYHDMRLEFGDYNWLLMQLSISDCPIQDLINYLK